ncbi:MAG: hypothetical protein J5716_05785 [Alphaproteobacteria bacterium]|nr:hypothetical protein [Alphaproteobacteria bacterium]
MLDLPEPSRVNSAAGQQDKHRYIKKIEDVPARYREHPRFDELSRDPAHKGDRPEKVLREAMSALEAEMSGKVAGPVTRGDTGYIDFYDGEGYPFDVKTPLSPSPGDNWQFSPYQVADTILDQLKKDHKNKLTGEEQPVAVLLDTTYMKEEDRIEMWRELRKMTKENRGILKRIFEVNVQLDPEPKKNRLSPQQFALIAKGMGR